jgi:Na(+)-translocating NADH:ubiquinone oxidoreductase C subunit
MVGFSCAVLLTLANSILKPLYEKNRLEHFYSSLSKFYSNPITSKEISNIKVFRFNSLLKFSKLSPNQLSEVINDKKNCYLLLTSNREVPKVYVINVKGIWGVITLMVGVAADNNTISKVIVLQQNETPGLGANITNKKFLAKFDGNKLLLDSKYILHLSKKKSLEENGLDGISGATVTSNAVSRAFRLIYLANAKFKVRGNK